MRNAQRKPESRGGQSNQDLKHNLKSQLRGVKAGPFCLHCEQHIDTRRSRNGFIHEECEKDCRGQIFQIFGTGLAIADAKEEDNQSYDPYPDLTKNYYAWATYKVANQSF